jgi:hypothetical protein
MGRQIEGDVTKDRHFRIDAGKADGQASLS